MTNEGLELWLGDEAFRDPHDAGAPAAWAAPGLIDVVIDVGRLGVEE